MNQVSKAKILLVIAVLAVLSGAVYYYRCCVAPIKYWNKDAMSFQECVEASRGFVMLSKPEQCTFRNRWFFNNSGLSDDEIKQWETHWGRTQGSIYSSKNEN